MKVRLRSLACRAQQLCWGFCDSAKTVAKYNSPSHMCMQTIPLSSELPAMSSELCAKEGFLLLHAKAEKQPDLQDISGVLGVLAGPPWMLKTVTQHCAPCSFVHAGFSWPQFPPHLPPMTTKSYCMKVCLLNSIHGILLVGRSTRHTAHLTQIFFRHANYD